MTKGNRLKVYKLMNSVAEALFVPSCNVRTSGNPVKLVDSRFKMNIRTSLSSRGARCAVVKAKSST